jgi:hypothetical protein
MSCDTAITSLQHHGNTSDTTVTPLCKCFSSFQDLHLRFPHRNGRRRLAYLSSDLNRHCIGDLLLSLFQHHDRDRFEVLVCRLLSSSCCHLPCVYCLLSNVFYLGVFGQKILSSHMHFTIRFLSREGQLASYSANSTHSKVFALSTRRKDDTHQSRIRAEVEHYIDVSCYDDHAIASLVQGTFTFFSCFQYKWYSLFLRICLAVVIML